MGRQASIQAARQSSFFRKVGLSRVYTDGSPIRDRDIATQYLRLILKVIGITDVTVIAGGGAKLVDLGEQTMGGFIANVEAEIERAAAA